MKNSKIHNEKPKRRFCAVMDGPRIRRLYATMRTADLFQIFFVHLQPNQRLAAARTSKRRWQKSSENKNKPAEVSARSNGGSDKPAEAQAREKSFTDKPDGTSARANGSSDKPSDESARKNENRFAFADRPARKKLNSFAFAEASANGNLNTDRLADRSASMKQHKFNFLNLKTVAQRRVAASALKKEHPNGRVLLLLWIEFVNP